MQYLMYQVFVDGSLFPSRVPSSRCGLKRMEG